MDPARKARLGQRWICFSCETRFYDLNRADAICPRCKADQRQPPDPDKARRPRSRKAGQEAKPRASKKRGPEKPAAAPGSGRKKAAGRRSRRAAVGAPRRSTRQEPSQEVEPLEDVADGVVDSEIELDELELAGDSNLEEELDDS